MAKLRLPMVPCPIGVARFDNDVVEVRTELVRHNLRKRRVQALAVGRSAGVDRDGAGWVDAYGGAFERSKATHLDIYRKPKPEQRRRFARSKICSALCLLGQEALVVADFDQLGQ
jgi:hypothetical protein